MHFFLFLVEMGLHSSESNSANVIISRVWPTASIRVQRAADHWQMTWSWRDSPFPLTQSEIQPTQQLWVIYMVLGGAAAGMEEQRPVNLQKSKRITEFTWLSSWFCNMQKLNKLEIIWWWRSAFTWLCVFLKRQEVRLGWRRQRWVLILKSTLQLRVCRVRVFEL